MLEDVRGIVIGHQTRLASIWVNGKELARTSARTMEDAVKWAKIVRVSRQKEIGDQEFKRLGWDCQWEVRFYD